ncbi:MAG: histidine phosphatase family protein [Candidatus Cloacimonetes bacterium]|nr:histidine phosphatase family protein [Candidatus Cloacimonadota bacterium]MCF7813143.1 histidine phosphatase family protein [Candidatus Cloacimonadota bacterium]MCF7867591.1 histidine phosphatase family protein [Candidatus Cloacimonadota bacterium]MCF7883134.1 histidine phosphatase family protein [Candidatus Cloacimonadota bacterium]
MKRIILMRHGKSSWKDAGLDDFDRPLKKRGRRDSPFMAEFLKNENLIPEMIFSSAALRTRQTTELANSILKLDESKIKFFDSFYLAHPKTILTFLTKLDNSPGQIMIVGHNPAMELLIKILTGETQRFPTAAVAIIDLDIANWNKLIKKQKCGILKHLWKPKNLRKKILTD